MTELPTPDYITYEWHERESQMLTCRATLDRAQLQAWIDRMPGPAILPEELDAEDIAEYLDANPDDSLSIRRLPGDEVLIEPFDAKVIQP